MGKLGRGQLYASSYKLMSWKELNSWMMRGMAYAIMIQSFWRASSTCKDGVIRLNLLRRQEKRQIQANHNLPKPEGLWLEKIPSIFESFDCFNYGFIKNDRKKRLDSSQTNVPHHLEQLRVQFNIYSFSQKWWDWFDQMHSWPRHIKLDWQQICIAEQWESPRPMSSTKMLGRFFPDDLSTGMFTWRQISNV